MTSHESRLLAAFPTVAAAERFVARLQHSPAHDLDRLAQRIVKHADGVADPARVLASVTSALANESSPLISEDGIAGMAALAAAQSQVKADAAAARAEGLKGRNLPGPLSQKSVWQRVIDSKENSPDAFGALLSAIRKSDIEFLITKCGEGTGTRAEREPAIAAALLSTLVNQDDPRFPLQARGRWVDVIKPRLTDVTQTYFRDLYLYRAWAAIDPAGVESALMSHVAIHGLMGRHGDIPQLLVAVLSGGDSDPTAKKRRAQVYERIIRDQIAKDKPVSPLLDQWIRLDRSGAARFLTKDWSHAGLSEPVTLSIVRGLALLATKPARARLLKVRELGGRTGDYAGAVLELLGEVPPTGLDAIAQAWQSQPTREVLGQFYFRYIDGMPALPIARWTDFMYARQTDEYSYAITTPDGGYLYLEVDRRGSLRGYKLGD